MQGGLTPLEAIQTATIMPARAMKLDKELGTLEAGKLADLVVLDGDPGPALRLRRAVAGCGLCAALTRAEPAPRFPSLIPPASGHTVPRITRLWPSEDV